MNVVIRENLIREITILKMFKSSTGLNNRQNMVFKIPPMLFIFFVGVKEKKNKCLCTFCLDGREDLFREFFQI